MINVYYICICTEMDIKPHMQIENGLIRLVNVN